MLKPLSISFVEIVNGGKNLTTSLPAVATHKPSCKHFISTSKGLMTDKEARSLNVGGEVLCYIS